MSDIKLNLKKWIDCNVNDGECRRGCKNDRITFNPDDLYELIDEMYEDEIEKKIKDLERQLSTLKQSNSDIEDMLVALKEEHEEEVKAIERKLEEARVENQCLAKGIQMRDVMIKSLQEQCVKLHLQIPLEQPKEQGDE